MTRSNRSFESSGAQPIGAKGPKGGLERNAGIALAGALAVSFLLGGGGSRYGFANLAVLLACLLALSFHRHGFAGFWTRAPRALAFLAGASILLPVLHLVPLPSGIWSALPSRDLVARSYELANIEASAWAPLSVYPARSALALLSLIVPLAVLATGWSVPRDRLILIGWIVVAVGIAQFLLGVVQVLSNGETGLFYPENPMPGVLFGFFANRNSTGLFLVGALTLAMLLPVPARMSRGALFLRIACVVLLGLGVVLTRSRTALVLAVLPTALWAWHALQARRTADRSDSMQPARNRTFILVVVALFIAALGVTFASSSGRIGETLDRFETTRSDARAYIWDDATYSVERYWPVGAGMGTFDDVFQIDESLENLSDRRAGRAHNDYLEIAIEAGGPGIILVALWLLAIVWLAVRARRSKGRWIAWSGATILLTIALQSITDYPLRNLSMLALAGFALLLLIRFGERGPHRTARKSA
ncbi:MAG: O-antigen ligase family protein [Erythrobacter sp.]